MEVHIGVDIGGTKIDVVAADASGEVAHRFRAPTGHGPDELVRTTLAAVARVCEDAGTTPRHATSIGVGVPGSVTDGVVTHAVNLGIDRLDLATALAAEWGVTPVIDNDVNAAAVGAWVLTGNGPRSMAYLNLGTGLAAGLILEGKLWRGARGAAGEIGHVSVNPDGPVDADGLRGGLETYASGSGIVRQFGVDGLSAVDVLARASDDPTAQAIRERLFYGVATAIRMLVLTVDVDEVVIAGGLAGMGDALLDGTTAVIDEWAHQSAFLASLELSARVRVLDPGLPVAAVGAAMRGAGRG